MCDAADTARNTKYVFIFINTIITFGGLILTLFAAIFLTNIAIYMYLLPYDMRVIVILSCAFGLVSCLASFVGLFGATKDNYRVLIGYVIFMFALAAVQIWITAEIFMNLSNLYAIVWVVVGLIFLDPDIRPGLMGFWENSFRCCGTTGGDSYHNAGRPTPTTCCDSPVSWSCDADPAGQFRGCVYAMSDYFHTFGNHIGSTTAVVVSAELAVALLGIFLIYLLTRKSRDNPENSGGVSLMRR